MKQYLINKGCKLCEACIWACPRKAISSDSQRASIDQSQCAHCGICYENCPNEAISINEISKPQ